MRLNGRTRPCRGLRCRSSCKRLVGSGRAVIPNGQFLTHKITQVHGLIAGKPGQGQCSFAPSLPRLLSVCYFCSALALVDFGTIQRHPLCHIIPTRLNMLRCRCRNEYPRTRGMGREISFFEPPISRLITGHPLEYTPPFLYMGGYRKRK